jgi:hypothetical protein
LTSGDFVPNFPDEKQSGTLVDLVVFPVDGFLDDVTLQVDSL